MNSILRRGLSLLTAAAVMVTMSFSLATTTMVFAGEDNIVEESPKVVVTGTGIIGEDYSLDNIGKEKTYTMDELQALAEKDSDSAEDNTYLYSALNTRKNTSIYKAKGVRVEALLSDAEITDLSLSAISFKANDGYVVAFVPATIDHNTIVADKITTSLADTRYYFPTIGMLDLSGETVDSDNLAKAEEGKVEVPTIIAWARAGKKGNTDPSKLGDFETWGNDNVMLITGQHAATDYNNPLWNGETNCMTVVIGDEIEDVITINGKSYSRADILAMDSITKTYSYINNKGNRKEKQAKGVLISHFIENLEDEDLVNFRCADQKEVETYTFTKKELVDGKFMLAYETGDVGAELNPVFDTSESGNGYFTLYGDENMPLKFIFQVTSQEVSVPDNLKVVSNSYNSNKLTWSSSSDEVDKYNIYRKSDSEAEFQLIQEITADKKEYSYTDENLKTGTKYTYKVTSVITWGGKTAEKATQTVSATPLTAVPGSFKASRADYNKIKLTWSPVSGASGYQVYMYDYKTKTYNYKQTVTGTSAKTAEITGLKTGTKYLFKVRSYRTVDGANKYGALSSSKYATPTLSKSAITKLNPGSKKITVKWKKVNGATVYKLYRATSKSGKYKLVKKTKSTSYTNKSLKKGKKYYYKVKAYRVVSGKTLGSSTSAVKSARAK